VLLNKEADRALSQPHLEMYNRKSKQLNKNKDCPSKPYNGLCSLYTSKTLLLLP